MHVRVFWRWYDVFLSGREQVYWGPVGLNNRCWRENKGNVSLCYVRNESLGNPGRNIEQRSGSRISSKECIMAEYWMKTAQSTDWIKSLVSNLEDSGCGWNGNVTKLSNTHKRLHLEWSLHVAQSIHNYEYVRFLSVQNNTEWISITSTMNKVLCPTLYNAAAQHVSATLNKAMLVTRI